MPHKLRERIDPVAIREGMGIGREELDRMKRFLEFGPEDVKRLLSLHEVAKNYADSDIDALYQHILSFDETKQFLQDPETLAYLRDQQKEYFLQLTAGEYDEKYVENLIMVAISNEVIGLPSNYYFGMYSFYMRVIMNEALKAFPDDPSQAVAISLSLTKLIFLDIGISADALLYRKKAFIALQERSILELSTPVLQLRDGLLILPIIGIIETNRARQLTEGLLNSIRANRAKVVIMDITGVPTVDTNVANHLMDTVEAARLMGATVIVTGLSSEVAQTVVKLGVNVSKLRTVGDLQQAIDEADRILGYRVHREEKNVDIQ